ncbi:hypothetical protein JHK84_036579 [Glycine max]|nr:hypothetical protein JHK85_036905 [Glycine max]KAG4976884.1 hypothetical protein JHK86_036358 [Glycine max]KAG5130182.1 hypothetical protein JHK84_036579 [Glycine max]
MPNPAEHVDLARVVTPRDDSHSGEDGGVSEGHVVFLAVVLPFMGKLGLEREMVYAMFRAFLQLSIIGFVLQFIFNQGNVG